VRVAALDLGTNTTRLLVADVDDGSVKEVRDADNGEAFLGEVEWSYGFKTRLLSGEDEALLTLRGVASGWELDGHALVIDIGGGSTELIAGTPEKVSFRISTDLGSVRLTERYLRGDPPGEGELSVCAAAIRSLLGERVPDETRTAVDTAIGVAGTITSLAALDLGLVEYDSERVNGHRLTHDAVHAQLTRLAAIPLAERRQVPGLDPERAPVIVAGAMILRETMRYFGLDEIEVSERDILDGAALEADSLPEPVEGDAPPGAYTCC
jgi:exopolyphosphatase / guanosine-5'-triphosphate,3'-diphosphate pyrophosphatase